MYNQYRRVQGGSSYADAMFRFGAHPKSYAEGMMERVLRKRKNPDAPFKYHAGEDYFLISYNHQVKLIEDFQFVEDKRAEGVHALEEWFAKAFDRIEDEAERNPGASD